MEQVIKKCRGYKKIKFTLLPKLFLLIVTLVGLFNLSSLDIQAVVNPDQSFYVTDKSHVLTHQTKEHILEINYVFEKTKERPQIAVVIIPTLDGSDIETYAVKQFEKMKIGNEKYDNGVLILLATEDREIRVEVGYGLEGALPDGKVGRILDASMENLASGHYSQAIEDIFNQIVLAIQDEYAYEDVFNGTVPKVESEEMNEVPIFGMIIGVIVVYFIVCRVIGINSVDALILLINLLSQGSNHSSSSHRSKGGGGRSGGGGASRNF